MGVSPRKGIGVIGRWASGVGRRAAGNGFVATLALALMATPVAAQQSHVLVITGVAGDPAFSTKFHEWATTLIDAATSKHGVAPQNVVYLSEKPELGKSTGKSTRESVQGAFAQLVEKTRAGDAVLVVLIGHGSADGGVSRFNLSGPDLTAEDYEKLLARLEGRKVALVNTSSASGGFVGALTNRGRTIVTATRSGMERNETVFAKFFVDAYAGTGADTDKDNQVSLLEAYTYAVKEVDRWYKEQNRLMTEHAVLDDDGDGKGTSQPDGRSGDGSFAKSFLLSNNVAAVADPALRALLEEKRQLEEKIEALRALKPKMEAATYEKELEKLLIDLSLKNQQIKQLEKKK
jgi:hypothetical protein